MSKRRKGTRTKTRTVGYGFVGVWCEGDIGWFLPKHLTGYGIEPVNGAAPKYLVGKERFVLCRITVEQVFDSKGRPIVRMVKP